MIADFWRQIVKQVFSNLFMKTIVDPLFQGALKPCFFFSKFLSAGNQLPIYGATAGLAAGQNVINWQRVNEFNNPVIEERDSGFH